eukprot:TRINITY_DN22303_c0_g1_i1.p1 TRINITY_DN22303_c0_g1~~TRINITY_DN22303_c0_g1_i1.p1  ORF type:complete len:366 (-),score=57.47 TRINITY_DN22303_c0_g1_i1:384-1415(-)
MEPVRVSHTLVAQRPVQALDVAALGEADACVTTTTVSPVRPLRPATPLLDAAVVGGHAEGWSAVAAPKFSDRPDLSCSLSLMAPAFRGSATAEVATPVAAIAAAPVSSLTTTTVAAVCAPTPVAAPSGTPLAARRSCPAVTALGAEAVDAASLFAAGPGPMMATPKNGDRPDLHCSVKLMTASFRGSAPRTSMPHAAAMPMPVAGLPPPLAPPTPSHSRPSTAPPVNGGYMVSPAPLALDVNEADGPCGGEFVCRSTPRHSERHGLNGSSRTMMSRSSRSIRNQILEASAMAAAPPPFGHEAFGARPATSAGSRPSTSAGIPMPGSRGRYVQCGTPTHRGFGL